MKYEIFHLQLDDYDPPLDVYLVGNSSKCVIWNYDWFGFDSGRTRQMCDFIAAHGKLKMILLHKLAI